MLALVGMVIGILLGELETVIPWIGGGGAIRAPRGISSRNEKLFFKLTVTAREDVTTVSDTFFDKDYVGVERKLIRH